MERLLKWLIVSVAPRVLAGLLMAIVGILVDAGLLDGAVRDALLAALAL